jgi:hypothetical protein
LLSCPAIAGKGDHAKRGGRGACLDATAAIQGGIGGDVDYLADKAIVPLNAVTRRLMTTFMESIV